MRRMRVFIAGPYVTGTKVPVVTEYGQLVDFREKWERENSLSERS